MLDRVSECVLVCVSLSYAFEYNLSQPAFGQVKPLLTKEKILQDYKDVFEGLGNITKASFTVDPEVTVLERKPS